VSGCALKGPRANRCTIAPQAGELQPFNYTVCGRSAPRKGSILRLRSGCAAAWFVVADNMPVLIFELDGFDVLLEDHDFFVVIRDVLALLRLYFAKPDDLFFQGFDR
jgi:hypothetical protein